MVDIPVLDKIERAGPTSVGRLDVQPIDTQQAAAPQNQAASSLVNETVQYIRAEEAFAADTAAKSRAVEFQAFFDRNFEGKDGLKYKKGEQAYTTDLKNFSDGVKQFKSTLITDDMSDSARSAVTAKLEEMELKFNQTLGGWAGKVQSDHEQTVTAATTDILKRDLMNDVAYVDPANPESTKLVDIGLAKIGLNIEDSAKKNGFKPNDPVVVNQIAKEKNDAIYDAVANLANAGDVERAQHLYDKYENQLNQVSKPRLKEKIQKASTEKEALRISNQVSNLPPEQIQVELGKIKDLALKEQVEKNISDHLTRMDNIKTKNFKTAYQTGQRIIDDRRNSGRAFVSLNEALTDKEVGPLVSEAYNRADASGRKAMEQSIVAPKNSDQKSLDKVSRAYTNGEFQGMSADTLNETMVGLNERARTRYRNLWERANDQNDGDSDKSRRWMLKTLEEQLIVKEVIRPKRFGNHTSEDLEVLNQYKDKMMEGFDTFSKFPTPNSTEGKQYVDKLIGDGEVEKILLPPAPSPKAPVNGLEGKVKATGFTKEEIIEISKIKNAAKAAGRIISTEEAIAEMRRGK